MKNWLAFAPFVYFMTACATDIYDIDDSLGFGRQFDGIGGISGGGVSYRNVSVSKTGVVINN